MVGRNKENLPAIIGVQAAFIGFIALLSVAGDDSEYRNAQAIAQPLVLSIVGFIIAAVPVIIAFHRHILGKIGVLILAVGALGLILYSYNEPARLKTNFHYAAAIMWFIGLVWACSAESDGDKNL